MNNIDTTLRILWLSDIHFSEHYTEEKSNDILNNFIKSFIKYCEGLNSIDYILLSGDIAQSGISSQYQLFFDRILNPIIQLENLKNAKLIFNSGNHDIKLDDITIFEEYINQVKEKNFDRKLFLTKKTVF